MHLLCRHWMQALPRLRPHCRWTHPHCHPSLWTKQQPVSLMIPLQPQSREGAAPTRGELNKQQEVATQLASPLRCDVQTSTAVLPCEHLSASD